MEKLSRYELRLADKSVISIEAPRRYGFDEAGNLVFYTTGDEAFLIIAHGQWVSIELKK